jgi:hypothetical protein
MTVIKTLLGEQNESDLSFTTGTDENENEVVTWKEWRFGGQLVRRDVHLHLKRGILCEGMAAQFG